MIFVVELFLLPLRWHGLVHIFNPTFRTIWTHHMVTPCTVITFWRNTMIPCTLTTVPFCDCLRVMWIVWGYWKGVQPKDMIFAMHFLYLVICYWRVYEKKKAVEIWGIYIYIDCCKPNFLFELNAILISYKS